MIFKQKRADRKICSPITSITAKLKTTILEKMSCFQTGGRQGHRPPKHLFVVKSILLRFEMQRRLCILNVLDIQAYFDRGRLNRVCNTLYKMDNNRSALRC